MGKDDNFGMKVLGAAALLGTAAAFGKTIWDAKNEAKTDLKSLDELLETQYITDVFGAAEAKEWFLNKTGGDMRGKNMLVARLNGELSERLGYTGFEKLDAKHYLLQAVMDEKKNILDIRLVNFGKLEEKFKNLLDEHNGMIIVRGAKEG